MTTAARLLTATAFALAAAVCAREPEQAAPVRDHAVDPAWRPLMPEWAPSVGTTFEEKASRHYRLVTNVVIGVEQRVDKVWELRRRHQHEWTGVGPITMKSDAFPFPQFLVEKDGQVRADGLPLVAGSTTALRPAGTNESPWLFVDAWHISRPFPTSKVSRAHTFPPGTLPAGTNAVFRSHLDVAPPAWTFTRSPSARVAPEPVSDMTTWYAYAELYSPCDQELLCAFGIDDCGAAWVNGAMVYDSGPHPHPWTPDRGYRRVHFRRGYNPVFLEWHNTWGRTAFSMCVLCRPHTSTFDRNRE